MNINRKLFAILLLIISLPLLSQSWVIYTSPQAQSVEAAANEPLLISFVANVDLTSLNDESIIIHGSLSGVHQNRFKLIFTGQPKPAQVETIREFAWGEKVTVVVTTRVEDFMGAQMPSAYTWEFHVQASSGNGIFTPSVSVSTIGIPNQIMAADLDADNIIDMAVYNQEDCKIHIYKNFGQAQLQVAGVADAGVNVNHIALADLNGDGKTDIITSHQYEPFLTVLYETGIFEYEGELIELPGEYEKSHVIAGDWNGDGIMDLAVSFYSSILPLMNNGDGSFETMPEVELDGDVASMTVADFNNNGSLDILASYRILSVTPVIEYGLAHVSNDGHGDFSTMNIETVKDSEPMHPLTLDVDLDGDLDICALLKVTPEVAVLFNDSGQPWQSVERYSLSAAATTMSYADVDKDTDQDLLLLSADEGRLTCLSNSGSGVFTQSSTFSIGNPSGALAIADFDGSGSMDAAVASQTTESIRIMGNRAESLNTGSSPNNIPEHTTLLPNYPNPFNPSTVIRYQLSATSTIHLAVYDINGQLVKTLINNESQPAKSYEVIWDGTNSANRRVSAGVYFYRLIAEDGFVGTGRMVLIK